MHFQEDGQMLSNRIILRCFPAETIRFRRSIINFTSDILEKTKSGGAINTVQLKTEPKYVVDEECNRSKSMRSYVFDFVEKLARMKNFWTSLPYNLCQEGQLAAREDDQCWNGTSIAPYTNRVIGNGVARQKFNPEFNSSYYKGTRKRFSNEMLNLRRLSSKLDAVYEDREFKDDSEGSALALSTNPDDEDSILGSGDLADDEIFDGETDHRATIESSTTLRPLSKVRFLVIEPERSNGFISHYNVLLLVSLLAVPFMLKH